MKIINEMEYHNLRWCNNTSLSGNINTREHVHDYNVMIINLYSENNKANLRDLKAATGL